MAKIIVSLKSVLKPLHTWTGIVAGTFLTVLALTGSLILFRAEFERAAFHTSEAAGNRVSLDKAASEVARFRPDWLVRRVRLPERAGDPYVYQIESTDKRTERVVCDAASGRVLGTIQPGAMDWLVDLHRNFLSGKQGRQAVGVAGIVLFLLSATGLLMWFSGPRQWRTWVSVRRSGSRRRFHFELHRVTGLWAYAFLALISFTGIERAFPDSFRQAVKAVTGQAATVPGPKLKGPASRIALEEYVRIGRGAMPDGVPVELRLSVPGKGPVDLRLYRAGDFSPSGNHIYLDASTGRVIQVDRIVDRSMGARFLAALAPIHYGQFGGLPIKLAWALMGLTPALLFVTGLIAWKRPSIRKAAERVASAEISRPTASEKREEVTLPGR